MKKKFFVKLLFCVTFFFPLAVFAQYSQLFEPSVPNYIFIEVDFNVAKNFEANIKAAHESLYPNIADEYKNDYIGDFNFDDGSKKKCKGKFKINGDWKDHIDPSRMIASLDVKLLDKCYIGGISKFKLFLPNTRRGSSEIFWSLLLNEYGFPTLYTRAVKVKFNGITYDAIFQEKPSTDFLERHGIRENPIVKHDERQIWETRKEWGKKNSQLSEADRTPDLFTQTRFQIPGIKWDDVDSTYGSIINSEFLQTELDFKIGLNALTSYRSANKEIENYEFYKKINNSYASHGLIYHNQRFIYNAITGTFIPLYYDGDVNFIEEAACELNERNRPTEEIVHNFEKLSGSSITHGMECAYARINDNKSLSNWTINYLFGRSVPVLIDYTRVGNLKTGKSDIMQSYVYSEDYRPYLVNPNAEKIKSFNIGEIRKFLLGNAYINYEGFKVSIVVAGERTASIRTLGFTTPDTGEITINVPEGVKYYVNVPKGSNRKIKVNLTGRGARVLFTGFMDKTDDIYINGNAENISNNDRHDDQMITGCATFYRFKFDGGTIVSDATGCEDSINILSSSGTIDLVEVRNATFDALDLDFSNIIIAKTIVTNAGNDCIDISSGTYQFEEAVLFNCTDKGISVGERSIATIRNVVINLADIGIAVKDQSHATIVKLNGKGIKSSCINSYIKKNKFDTPSFSVDNQACTKQL